MIVEFYDREEESNPRNGERFSNVDEVNDLLETLRVRPPFLCELIGDNDYNLMVGIGGDVGCVQYSAGDGTPPYLMAVGRSEEGSPEGQCMEFLAGGTLTPVKKRYCMPFDDVREIVSHYILTGTATSSIQWEQI